jgi:3-methyladenine DNA glycosylase AlkC
LREFCGTLAAMAEPLKNHFGADVPATIAAMVAAVHPPFPARAFLRDALKGYDALELMPRGRHLAQVLHTHLPAHYPEAVRILVQSTQQPVQRNVGSGMAGFLFMPHCFFVSQHGLAHFDESMAALHTLTQRFTAEFAIRPFLIQQQDATLQRLRTWAHDPSEHVRRLVSEGTRPRLPWAMRLPSFQANPAPALALLELLKDDPALYVRRSVANHLNDIGKDHPALLTDTARRWLKNASPEREWIVRHALRWAVKQGDAGALKVLGFVQGAQFKITNTSITPHRVKIGSAVAIAFRVQSTLAEPQDLMVDLQVHYAKANGKTSAKVFKLTTLRLDARGSVPIEKKLKLEDLTTRKHYAGRHRVEALVNGAAYPVGEFELLP